MCALTLKIKSQIIDFAQPKIMGILNITPDSFYDGGAYTLVESAIARIEKMVSDGALIIDIGAYSTRPGSNEISSEKEWQRLEPVLKFLYRFPKTYFSIDTFRAEIARRSVADYGMDLVNDISGGTFDDKMYETIALLKVPYVLMHVKGEPKTMHQAFEYSKLGTECLSYFIDKINNLKILGINDVVIDPGFGFSKNLDQNFALLKELNQFQLLGKPVLAGLSRKSMIFKTLGIDPMASLNGTTALNMIALLNGANILRVHDVKEAAETIALFKKYVEA